MERWEKIENAIYDYILKNSTMPDFAIKTFPVNICRLSEHIDKELNK